MLTDKPEFEVVEGLYQKWMEILNLMQIPVVPLEGGGRMVSPEYGLQFIQESKAFNNNLSFRLSVFEAMFEALYDNLTEAQQAEVVDRVVHSLTSQLEVRDKAVAEARKRQEAEKTGLILPKEKKIVT